MLYQILTIRATYIISTWCDNKGWSGANGLSSILLLCYLIFWLPMNHLRIGIKTWKGTAQLSIRNYKRNPFILGTAQPSASRKVRTPSAEILGKTLCCVLPVCHMRALTLLSVLPVGGSPRAEECLPRTEGQCAAKVIKVLCGT